MLLPIISSVLFISSPLRPSTTWDRPYFPNFSNLSNGLPEAKRKSISVALSNSSHGEVFASAITNAAALLATQYVSAASSDPWDNQAQKASFIHQCVHQWVHQLPPPQSSGHISWKRASAMEVLNMVHSDSMSPTSTLTAHFGLTSLSDSLPRQQSQLTTRW